VPEKAPDRPSGAIIGERHLPEKRVIGKATFVDANEVKPRSPHHRLMIALHSPGGVAETGLRVCPPEKSARKLARDVRRVTFSGAV
jgi:hypothetical protein